jgi:tetratricopeptide (TPR) repeat protein
MPEETMESPDQVVQRWLRGDIRAGELFALSAQSMKALAEHGYLLYEQGKYESAKTIFEGLANIDNSNPHYQRLLGSIYQLEEKWDAAYYRYTQALRYLPKDIFVLTNRGEVLVELNRTREAGEDLKQAVLLDPQGSNPAGRRARLLLTYLNSPKRSR